MSKVIAPIDRADSGDAQTRGVVFVHACSRALSPHVEWALAHVLQREISLDWTGQPVLPGAVRAEYSWHGSAGTAARIVTALRGFTGLRYEVTEEPTPLQEGERYSVTPDLGTFRGTIGPHGDVQVSEHRIRWAMEQASVQDRPLAAILDDLMGTAWDEELEPFRYAGQGAPVRYLHRVG
jgi:hypothetical protein